MDDARYEAELRELRRELGRVKSDTERARRASVGLVIALVGLVGGLCLPWFMTREPLELEGGGRSGGIQEWLDGWLVLGESVADFGDGGWAFFVATAGVVLLAVLVGLLLVDLGPSRAKAVTIMGWVGVVGLSLTWLALAVDDYEGVGVGVPVAAVASLVAALSARSVRDLRPRREAPVPSAGALLGTPVIRATPPPED